MHSAFSTTALLYDPTMSFRHRLSLKRLFTLSLWLTFGGCALLAFLALSSPRKHFAIFPGRATRYSDVEGAGVTVPESLLLEHPIKTLFRKSEADFDELLSRQSATFEVAALEYLRRYRRDPPPGFEIWYEYATRHRSVIIDEFDIIEETLAPFWALSGSEVKRRLENERDTGPSLSYCRPFDGATHAGCKSLGGELSLLLSEPELLQHLSEVGMLINTLDEPRVLPERSSRSVGTREGVVQAQWTDFSHQHVWDEITADCYHDNSLGPASSSHTIRTSQTIGPIFYTNQSREVDLCRHPEYSTMHGIWRSPTNLRITRSSVPILSPAVLSTMGDIPFPAPAYSSNMFAYDESEDVHWENKTLALYWAGSSTGSFQQGDEGWRQDHRQRFVSFANDLEPQPHAYLQRQSGRGEWQEHESSVLDHSLYKVHFTDVVQCADRATEDAIRAHFEIHDVEGREEAFKYALTFDLDGNGHSGRFYRLLKSQSLPLKQTVFREWHDERLQPWQHFVPISLTMQDLPEAVRYLTDEEEGRQIAALMAERGRQWALRTLRPVDQAIYLFRLMIELSRLQDPDRPAHS